MLLGVMGEIEGDESSTSSSSMSGALSWQPKALAFSPYALASDKNAKPKLLQGSVRRPVCDYCLHCKILNVLVGLE